VGGAASAAGPSPLGAASGGGSAGRGSFGPQWRLLLHWRSEAVLLCHAAALRRRGNTSLLQGSAGSDRDHRGTGRGGASRSRREGAARRGVPRPSARTGRVITARRGVSSAHLRHCRGVEIAGASCLGGGGEALGWRAR